MLLCSLLLSMESDGKRMNEGRESKEAVMWNGVGILHIVIICSHHFTVYYDGRVCMYVCVCVCVCVCMNV